MKKLCIIIFLILFGCGPAISYDMQNTWQEIDQATDEVQAAQPLPDSVLIPPGGTTGQILMKKSNTDGDTYWADAPTGSCDPATDYVGGGDVPLGTEYLLNTNQVIIQLFTPTCSGAIQELIGQFQVSGTSSAVLMIYLDDGDGIPNVGDTLVDYGAVTFTAVTGEVSVAATNGASVNTGNQYWVGVVNNPDNTFRVHYTTGSDCYSSSGHGDWYPTPPANLGGGTWTTNSNWQNIGVWGTIQ